LMNDPEHSAIILNPNFNSVGVGIVCSADQLYVTEDFAQVRQNYSNDEAANAVADAVAAYASSHGFPEPLRKPQPQLQPLACNLSQTHVLDSQAVQALPGFAGAVAWATTSPRELPSNAKAALSQPLPSGYSLAACLAPGAGASTGMYWILMITY